MTLYRKKLATPILEGLSVESAASFRLEKPSPAAEVESVLGGANAHDEYVPDLQAEKDAASGARSRVKGTESSHELYGTPEERAEIKQAVRDKYERMKAASTATCKKITVTALHAALAIQFNCSQRTIRRYLKE